MVGTREYYEDKLEMKQLKDYIKRGISLMQVSISLCFLGVQSIYNTQLSDKQTHIWPYTQLSQNHRSYQGLNQK